MNDKNDLKEQAQADLKANGPAPGSRYEVHGQYCRIVDNVLLESDLTHLVLCEHVYSSGYLGAVPLLLLHATAPVSCELAVDMPTVGSRWRHFKGGFYAVIYQAVLATTLEPLVCYESEQNGSKWARPLSDFMGIHPEHKVQRFTPIE